MYTIICKSKRKSRSGWFLNKYETLLQNEYNNMSENDKKTIEEILDSRIMSIKMEKSTIILAQGIIQKDQQLKSVFPGHIKAQYSDKLKKYQKEIHYLESIKRSMTSTQGMTR